MSAVLTGRWATVSMCFPVRSQPAVRACFTVPQSGIRSLYNTPSTAEVAMFNSRFNTTSDVAFANDDEYLFSAVGVAVVPCAHRTHPVPQALSSPWYGRL